MNIFKKRHYHKKLYKDAVDYLTRKFFDLTINRIQACPLGTAYIYVHELGASLASYFEYYSLILGTDVLNHTLTKALSWFVLYGYPVEENGDFNIKWNENLYCFCVEDKNKEFYHIQDRVVSGINHIVNGETDRIDLGDFEHLEKYKEMAMVTAYTSLPLVIRKFFEPRTVFWYDKDGNLRSKYQELKHLLKMSIGEI